VRDKKASVSGYIKFGTRNPPQNYVVSCKFSSTRNDFNYLCPLQGQNLPGPGRSGAKNIPNTGAGKNKVSVLFFYFFFTVLQHILMSSKYFIYQLIHNRVALKEY